MPNPYRDLTSYYRGQRYLGGGTADAFASLGDIISKSINQIQAKRQQDKLDGIANDLIAQMQAPKAEAVGDAPSGPAPTSDDEAAHNAALGFSFGNATIPNKGGQAALNLLLDAKMKQAAIAKSFAPPVAKAGVVKPAPVMVNVPGYGPMSPARAAAHDIAAHREERASDKPDPVMVGTGYGPMTPRQAARTDHERNFTNQPIQQRNDPKTDPAALYADWLKKVAGLSPTELLNPNGWQHVDASGKPSAAGDFYLSNVPDGSGGTNPKQLPASIFNSAKQRYLANLAGTGGSAAPTPTGPGMSGHAIGSEADNTAPSPDTGAAPASSGPPQTGPNPMFPVVPSPADAIRQQYRAGQLSKDEAAAQLRNLGFN